MKFADWVQQILTLRGGTWYPATTVISERFFNELDMGAEFCGGFESALAMVVEFGVPDDLTEMFSNT